MQSDATHLRALKDKGHRRTQSNSNFDFRPLIGLGAQKENDQNFRNMVEMHQVMDKNQTKLVLDQESRKQSISVEKQVVVENIEPGFQELNRNDNNERNFFIFGKKSRNLTTIFGESSVLRELDVNDLSNRKKSGPSIHETSLNPAKRYERELLKDEKIFVIPEQNDLLQSTEFPNNKLVFKKEEVPQEESQCLKREGNFVKSSRTDEEKSASHSSSKAEHFRTLMHLKGNLAKALGKTNNRYDSKDEPKTSRGIHSRAMKDMKDNSTIKAKKNCQNSMTIKLLREKKFSTTAMLNFPNEKCLEGLQNNFQTKHKKNSVSVATKNKKDVSFTSVKKSEKSEKDSFSKLENQVCILKKKVEYLETQNKDFREQLAVITEEKYVYMKANEEYLNRVKCLEDLLMKNSENYKILEKKVNYLAGARLQEVEKGERNEKIVSGNENSYLQSNCDISTSGTPKNGSTFTQYLQKKSQNSQNKSYCTPRSNESRKGSKVLEKSMNKCLR